MVWPTLGSMTAEDQNRTVSAPPALRSTNHYRQYGGSVAEWLACMLDSGAEGPGFKSQARRCRVTVLGKLFTPIVPLFTKQRNW